MSEGFDSFKPIKLGEIDGGRKELVFDSIEPQGHIKIFCDESYQFNHLDLTKNLPIIGFDESILEYKCLEGDFKATAFCFVTGIDEIYNPAILLDLRFMSKIQATEELEKIRLDSSNIYAFEEFYHKTRLGFISDLKIENSLIFIDGPIFSGRHTDFNFKMFNTNPSNDFIFFVKNSQSDGVIRLLNLSSYNSDLHWAYKRLNVFERSPIFMYSSHNREKLFCYIKVAENYSPIRVETPFDGTDFFTQKNTWVNIFKNIIAQMPSKNIQPRSIAIAERYAREALKTSNIYSHLVKSGYIATMNEQRF